jgi:hypothetical protein
MPKSSFVSLALSLLPSVAVCGASDAAFKLALVNRVGQLSWSAEGYEIVQYSAKPNGSEVGIRSRNESGIGLIGFLFLFPETSTSY